MRLSAEAQTADDVALPIATTVAPWQHAWAVYAAGGYRVRVVTVCTCAVTSDMVTPGEGS